MHAFRTNRSSFRGGAARRGLWIAACCALLAPGVSSAHEDGELHVVTTLPYLAEVVRAVGGDRVEVEALAPPGQDPHFIQPTPARSLTLSKAHVLIENGVQLELWSERVIDGARNQQIRPGYPGHLYAAVGVRPLQVPRQQTRASGDVHVGGNPHVWLDPLNLKTIARNVEQTLAGVRPGSAEAFAKNRRAFEERLDRAYFGEDLLKILGNNLLTRLQRQGTLVSFLQEKQFQGEPLVNKAGGWLGRSLELGPLKVISYHQVWTYFASVFPLEVVATIEEKPGIPPSPGHLDQLEQVAGSTGAKVVLVAPFYPLSRAEGVAERIGGTAIVLPTQPGEEGTTGLFDLFDTILERLAAAKAKVAGQ